MKNGDATKGDNAYRVLSSRDDGKGNVILLFDRPVAGACGDEVRVLKLYRRRRTRLERVFSDLSHRFFERKRGVGAPARCETERLSLEMWNGHGFDALKCYDLPLPSQVEPPGLWLEYCPGTTLSYLLSDRTVDLDENIGLVRRVASASRARHRLGLELSEPLLVHEHATVNHVLVHEKRLVYFDFEGGFLPGFPVLEALAQEMANFLRSVMKYRNEDFDALLEAYVDGYSDADLLREIAHWGVQHRGLYRSVRRWYDERRRPENTKTDCLRRLLAVLT